MRNQALFLLCDKGYKQLHFITSIDGKMLEDGEIDGLKIGNNEMNFSLENANENVVIITFILDNKYYASQKVIRQ